MNTLGFEHLLVNAVDMVGLEESQQFCNYWSSQQKGKQWTLLVSFSMSNHMGFLWIISNVLQQAIIT